MQDPNGRCSPVLPFLIKRTKAIEIVVTHDIVFSLNHSCVFSTYSQDMSWFVYLKIVLACGNNQ